MKRLILGSLLSLSLLIFAGCGGDNGPGFFFLPPASTFKITTATPLPAGTVGTFYSVPLAATGGTTPYTWTVAGGSTLPAGLTLSSSGVLFGTPTTAATSIFTITVTDSASPANTASKQFSLTVAAAGAALTITTTSPLPSGTVGTPYSETLAASGGTAPYTWTLAAGSTLPAGLSLSTGGVITGTPTTAATSTFTITVTDSATPTAHTVSKAFSLTVAAVGTPLTITTTSPLPGGTVGTAYTQALVATGGTAPYSWAVTAGTPPAGLSLTTAGVITGTPTTAATSTFTVTVTDSATPVHTAPQAFSLTITAGAPAAPTGVVATGGTNSETITWPTVAGATSYNIYFSATSGVTPATGTSVTVPQPSVPVTSPYRHSRLSTAPTWLAANTPYFYVVTAVNAVGEGPPSAQVSATTSSIDGVALYGTNCASCHRSLATTSKPGRTATQIQTAIVNNTGGMGSIAAALGVTGLTPISPQVQAIADVLVIGF